MHFFSQITQQRITAFVKNKKAYYAFLFLVITYLFSLTTPWTANHHPLVASYNGSIVFPAFTFYTDQELGGSYTTEVNYFNINKNQRFDWYIDPLIPYNPLESDLSQAGQPPFPPSAKHILGTDAAGRDVLSRLIHGYRICMSFALLITFITTILGIIIGGVQGYFGGKLDLFMQRIVEIWSSLPLLYVVILIGAIYGRSFFMLVMIMSLFNWIALSYYMRGEFLQIKSLTFVKAAKSFGLSRRHIFFKEILPNSLTPVITILPFSVIAGIGSLTALDFLGFGLQPPTPSWGELLSQGLAHLYAPWISITSVVALFITLLLASFVGEGVREAFDPKSKKLVK